MDKHIELLKQFPNNYFDGFGWRLENIKNGCRIYQSNIACLYHALGKSMNQGSKTISRPIEIGYSKNIDCYSFLDYINPYFNHIFEYVYHFALPKMYKNALVKARPSTRQIELKPKQGIKFEEVYKLREKFIKTSFLHNTFDFSYWSPAAYEEHLNLCYDTLTELLEKADLVYNDTPSNERGSVVLAKELNNLLFNQNMLARRLEEIRYAPHRRQKIMSDIIAHKKAMFGELQR